MKTLDLQALGLEEMIEEEMIVLDGGKLNFDFFMVDWLWGAMDNQGMRAGGQIC